MAEKLGKKVICDRCGKHIFLEYICAKSLDGGFTRVKDFEPIPDDWLHSFDLNMRLCNECTNEFKAMLERFKKGGSNEV